MFKYRKNMYISPSIRNVSKVKLRLSVGRGQFNVYLIVFNHDSGKLEYFHNGILKQKALFKRTYDVIGFASNPDECIEIITGILNEAYEKYGEYDLAKYLDT